MNWAGLLPLALMLFAMCDRAQEVVSLPVVEVGGAAFMVEIAASPDERSRGLSGRDRLPEGSGMLFVYNEPAVPGFWMRGMRFALDFVWIGADCEVADLTPDVPAPGPATPVGELPVYRPSTPVLFNLEVNAGSAARHDIGVGDAVRFHNIPGGAC